MTDETVVVAADTVAWLRIKLFDMQGNELDATPEEGTPVLIGHEDILAAVENAVIGKKVGEELTVHLEPEQAFGDYDPELIQIIDSDLLGDHVEIGMKVEGVPGQENDGRIYTIYDASDDKVVLDGNHPLAGMGLVFDIKVMKVEKPNEVEIEQMEESDLMPDLLEVPNVEKSSASIH